MERLPDHLFRFLIKVWCLCGESENEHLPPLDDVAYHLRVEREQAERYLQELEVGGYLDRDDIGLIPHDWADLQFVGNSSSDRTSKYRAKLRESGSSPALFDRLRPSILIRDSYTCVYCLATEKLVVDHIVPIAKGGKTEEWNLVTACKACNSGKSGRTPHEARMQILAPHAVKIIADAINRSISVTVTGRDSVTVTPSVSVSVSGSVSGKGGLGGNQFEISDWFETIWQRHPKKKDRTLAEQALVRFLRAGGDQHKFDVVHAAWCQTEAWSASQGRFCPRLAEWVDDRGYISMPPVEKTRPMSLMERRLKALEDA